MLSAEQIRNQSQCAIDQWGDQWRKHSKHHSRYKMKNLNDFINHGIGRAVLCVANGYSFEENVETIRELQENVDILCCDKTLGNLLDNGITPDFCMVCDANVDYERYMEKYKDQLEDTVLFINACANPKWTDNGNWKDRYFFVNKDILNSEREFCKLSGCPNVIPAGTNVSNAMIVFLTQSDNEMKRNFFGYDKILLIGFDYSWRDDKYYAFNANGDGKDNYMRHIHGKMIGGDYCYTSNNLHFSMKWIEMYVKTFNLPVVQCTKNTIYATAHMSDLKTQMKYEFESKDREVVKNIITERAKLLIELTKADKLLDSIGFKHNYAFLASV